MRVLVCGGRDFNDANLVEETLNNIHEENTITNLVHGGARGADTLAGDWANSRGIDVTYCPAKWDLYGKSAGMIRNAYMLTLNPDLVVAFPGGKGTANMVNLAKKRGVSVIVIG